MELIRNGKLTCSPLTDEHDVNKLTVAQKCDLREILQKSNAGGLSGKDALKIINLRKAARK